jgi:hypothetical protein
VHAATAKVIPMQLPLQLQTRFARPAGSFSHHPARTTATTTHPQQEITDARSEIIAEGRP